MLSHHWLDESPIEDHDSGCDFGDGTSELDTQSKAKGDE